MADGMIFVRCFCGCHFWSKPDRKWHQTETMLEKLREMFGKSLDIGGFVR